MRVIVLHNPSAGPNRNTAEEIRAAFDAAGVSASVRDLCEHDDPTQIVRELLAHEPGCDAIVAAGGDGTVGAVAAALVDNGVPLGVLPLGTLNHFARDLGIAPTLAEAVGVIAARCVSAVDVGQVNDHVFINNASIGLYPHIVRHRDDQRQRLGRGKWLAMLLATLTVFRRYPTVRVRLGIDDATEFCTTPFVFVGNNKYEMTLTMLGRRLRLDAGELCVYFANRTGRFGLLRLALRALLGRLEQSRDFTAISAGELWIEASRRSVRVATDGEVREMKPPLHCVSRRAALKVIVPAAATAAAEADDSARGAASAHSGGPVAGERCDGGDDDRERRNTADGAGTPAGGNAGKGTARE